MKGTASALRLSFGGAPGPDPEGDLLRLDNSEVPIHVMEAYALANVRLCSAVRTGSTDSRASTVMTANCAPHLEATVRILQPTLCILQSGPARRHLSPCLHDIEQVTDNLERVTIAGVRVYLASFVHPRQYESHAGNNWGSSFSTEYLDTVVAPTIREARTRALVPPARRRRGQLLIRATATVSERARAQARSARSWIRRDS